VERFGDPASAQMVHEKLVPVESLQRLKVVVFLEGDIQDCSFLLKLGVPRIGVVVWGWAVKSETYMQACAEG
jgi:hypothetical protein